jgi:hypothetical protein
MSMRVLLLAVKEHLIAQSSLGLTANNCDIVPRGKPIPNAAETFVGIWPGHWRQNDAGAQWREDEYGINVTVSVRLPKVPVDRIGTELISKATVGLEAVCEKIANVIHMDPDIAVVSNCVRIRANTLLGSGVPYILTPLVLRDGGTPDIKGAEWFYSTATEQYAGIVQTLMFAGCTRPMKIEDQLL